MEDDPRVRTALAQTLDHEPDLDLVGQAGDAFSGLEAAAVTRPEVALVDVRIPDVRSGVFLIHALTAQAGCVVVAMSMWAGLRRPALAAGAIAFTEKGAIDPVLAAIREAARPSAPTPPTE